MVETVRSADQIDRDLQEVVRNRRQNLRRIGELLNEAALAGLPMAPRFDFLRNAGINKATASVAMRWAAGELGDDSAAVLLVEKVPHTVLSQMGSGDARKVATQPHVIYSRIEGRATQKRLADMDRQEVIDNIGPSGFRPLAETAAKPPTERAYRARSIKRADDGSILVSAGKDDEIWVRLSGRQLRELRSMLKSDDEADGSKS